MRKLLALIVLSVLFVACQGHPSAEDIVKKMNDVYDGARSFMGVAEFYIVSENGTLKKEVSFIVSKPNKFRVEGERFVTGSNGEIIWTYDKYNNTIVKEDKYRGYRPDVDYGQFIENLQKFDLKFDGVRFLNGTECYVISACSKDLKIKITIYVDKNTFIPVRFETEFKNTTAVMEYKSIKIDVPVNDSIFEPPRLPGV
jgi:outer membrane lipoprotein-sorting protein